MISLYRHLHICNSYCELGQSIHASISLTAPSTTEEDLVDYYGKDLIVAKRVSEVDIEKVKQSVVIRSETHTVPWLIVCYGTLQDSDPSEERGQ